MDERIVFEKGVVRMSARQLSCLWLEMTDKCGVVDIVDIRQPSNFLDDVEWDIFQCVEGEDDWL